MPSFSINITPGKHTSVNMVNCAMNIFADFTKKTIFKIFMKIVYNCLLVNNTGICHW